MASFRREEVLAGLTALAAMGWVIWILVRGVRDERLPIGKSEVLRAQRPGAFATLFALYVLAAAAMAFIAIDLIVGITGR